MCSQPPFHLVGFASSGDAAKPDDGLAVLESLVENYVGVAFNCVLLIFWSFVVLLQLLPFNVLQSLGRKKEGDILSRWILLLHEVTSFSSEHLVLQIQRQKTHWEFFNSSFTSSPFQLFSLFYQ